MNISQIVIDEIQQQLEQCQSNVDNLSNVIARLQEILVHRQEDEEKLAEVLHALQGGKILLPTSLDTLSLILLETSD